MGVIEMANVFHSYSECIGRVKSGLQWLMSGIGLLVLTMISTLGFRPESAHAACLSAGKGGYTITAQATSVDLDADCPGAGGPVTVTGNVTSAGSAGIIDPAGFDDNWAVTVDIGVTVDASTIGVLLGSANGSVFNIGTINAENSHGVQMNFGGTVTNFGTIETDLFTGQDGVLGNAGGTVINQAGGFIIGNREGVDLQGGIGTVTNAGTIRSLNKDGVALRDGGTVTNQAGGTILADDRAVFTTGAAGTVNNVGTITSLTNDGVQLDSGGTVTNQASATITGFSSGIESNNVTIGVTNAGTITGLGDDGVDIEGGTVTNQTGGTITGNQDGVDVLATAGTVTNAATITGTNGIGVDLAVGGTVTNQTGGMITGRSEGIDIDGGGSVNNLAGGTITGTAGDGIEIDTGTVINAGTITGQNFDGVRVQAGGTVNNQTGGTITGGLDGISFATVAGTVTNSGTITGQNAEGVSLGVGGTVTNLAGGTISGDDEAVLILGAAGNVTNAGTLNGNSSAVVAFDAFDDRMEVQSGSVINGDVQASAGTDTLAFGGTGTSTFDISLIDGNNTDDGEQFLNFETFIKEDASTFTFTGTNTEVNAFAVNGGTLVHNGALTNGVFTVNGGVLGGTGSSAGLVANTGGAVAPGNSIGTMQVNGNVLFNAGSIYQVEIDSTPASDLINATGTATLNGGTVQVITLSPEASFVDGTVFTILTAAGGVTGAFAGLTHTSAFFDFLLSYDVNNVFLTLKSLGDFTSTAVTSNQVASSTALGALDAPGDATAVFNAVSLLSAPQSRAAFDVVSGEVHASVQQGVLDAADLFTSSLQRRAGRGGGNEGAAQALSFSDDAQNEMSGGRALGLAAGETVAAGSDMTARAWGSVLGSRSDYDGNGDAAAFDLEAYGVVGGVDIAGMWNTMNVAGGVAAGFTKADADVTARASVAEISSWHVGTYGALGMEPLEVFGAMSYAAHDIETTRSIVFPGINRVATASYDAGTFSASAEALWRFALNNEAQSKWTIAPLARMEVLTGSHTGATEAGAGALNLNIASQNFDRVDGGLGISLGYSGVIESWNVSGDMRATWLHAFDDSNPTQTLSFAGAAATPFTIRGVNRGADRLALGFGLDVDLSDQVSLSTGYDGSIFGNATDHRGHVALSLHWN